MIKFLCLVSALGSETIASSAASGHYNAGATPCSSASSRAGRKSNRINADKDKVKSKRHAGRQQRRDHETHLTFPIPKLHLVPAANHAGCTP